MSSSLDPNHSVTNPCPFLGQGTADANAKKANDPHLESLGITMATKSPALTTPTAAAEAIPAELPLERNQGRFNPLSAIMMLSMGKQPSAAESSELAKFITGVVRLTDTHIYAVAKFFQKRYHVQLSTLALKVARYQAAHTEGLTLQAAKAALEDLCGVQYASWDNIEGSFSNEYAQFTLEQVKQAHANLWDAYGKQGTEAANLIGLANEYDKETRAERQAEQA